MTDENYREHPPILVDNGGVPHFLFRDQLVNIENTYPQRARPGGAFSTTNIDSYVDYVKINGAQNTAIFIDDATYSSVAVLDFDGGASDANTENLDENAVFCGRGFHQWTASLNMKKTAAFTALTEISGSVLSQKKAVQFFQEWRSFANDGSSISTALRTLKATENAVKEHSAQRNGGRVSAVTEIEAKSTTEVPATTTFWCQPLHGLKEIRIPIDIELIVEPGLESIGVKITIDNIELITESIAQSVQTLITDKLGEFPIYIGKFKS